MAQLQLSLMSSLLYLNLQAIIECLDTQFHASMHNSKVNFKFFQRVFESIKFLIVIQYYELTTFINYKIIILELVIESGQFKYNILFSFFKMMNSNLSINGKTYKICAIIGEGAAAVVYLAKDTSNKCYALKMIKRYSDPITKHMVDEEIRIQKEFQGNKYVIQFLGYEKMDKTIYIVLELGECSLSHWISTGKQIWQSQFINMICDVCEGLMSIHSKKVIHRDIKPQNIIKKDGIYKITDFGVSCEKEEDDSISGTLLYWAPQILFEESNTFTNKVDVWSFGVTAFEVYFKVNPFFPGEKQKLSQNQCIKQLKNNIKQLTPNFTLEKFINFLVKKNMNKEVKFIQKKMQNTHKGLVENLCLFFQPKPEDRLDIDLLYGLFESLKSEVNCQFRKSKRLKKFSDWSQVPEDIKMFCRAKDLFYQLSTHYHTNLYKNVLFGLELGIWYISGRNYGGINYVLLDEIDEIKKYHKPSQELWQEVKQNLSQYYFYLATQEQIKAFDKLAELRMHILVCSIWWKVLEDYKYFCNMVLKFTKFEIDHPLNIFNYLQIFSDKNISDIEQDIVNRYYCT